MVTETVEGYKVPERVNPYIDPEKAGLLLVDSFDDPQASYDFDMVCVWKDEHGSFYYDRDSGCSCPSPFEAYEYGTTGNDNIIPALTSETFDEFQEAVYSIVGLDEEASEYQSRYYTDTNKADAKQFVQDIRRQVLGLDDR